MNAFDPTLGNSKDWLRLEAETRLLNDVALHTTSAARALWHFLFFVPSMDRGSWWGWAVLEISARHASGWIIKCWTGGKIVGHSRSGRNLLFDILPRLSEAHCLLWVQAPTYPESKPSLRRNFTDHLLKYLHNKCASRKRHLRRWRGDGERHQKKHLFCFTLH